MEGEEVGRGLPNISPQFKYATMQWLCFSLQNLSLFWDCIHILANTGLLVFTKHYRIWWVLQTRVYSKELSSKQGGDIHMPPK